MIITADDFGQDSSVNAAINRCFENKLINSVSLLTNMEGFNEAVKMINNNHDYINQVGLHFNLTMGRPLTRKIKSCKFFCDDHGNFSYKRKKRIFFLNKVEQAAVYGECKAQLLKAHNAGIVISHFDSHHHIHTEWGILPIILKLSKEYGIKKIRPARNLGPKSFFIKHVYKNIFNKYIQWHSGDQYQNYCGEIDDFCEIRNTIDPKKRYEIFVHPELNAIGEVVNFDIEKLRNKFPENKISQHSLTPIFF